MKKKLFLKVALLLSLVAIFLGGSTTIAKDVKKESKETISIELSKEDSKNLDLYRKNLLDKNQQEFYKNFVDTMAHELKPIAEEHDMYTSVLLGELILESNFGRATLSIRDSNWYSIKEGRNFVKYKNLEDNVNSVIKQIDGRKVKYKKSDTRDYREGITAFNDTFHMNNLYERKMNLIITHFDLTKYDV